nr:DNA polymerase III subunit beta [Armatimonadota bacterium]
MNMTCSRRDLNEAVQTVGRAAATQSALPILNHILLAVHDDELQLTATDSELSSRTSIPVVGRLQGPIAIPAKAFGEILLSLPDGDLDLSVGGRHTLMVRQGEIRFELKGLPGGEFPTIPVVHIEGDRAARVQFDQPTMRRLLRQTSFSVSTDPTRVQYTGILFEGDAEVFRLVSTDGVVRVAISSAPLEEPGTPISAIVPARTVTEFSRLLRGDGEGRATIYFRNDPVGPTLASFEANGVMLVSRLIEGQFAPWRRVVPQSYQERATVK